MFRRDKVKLSKAQIDLLVVLADNELSNTLDSIGAFGNADVRRVCREYIEALDAVRNVLVRLK